MEGALFYFVVSKKVTPKQEAFSKTPTLLRLIYQKSDGRYVLLLKN